MKSPNDLGIKSKVVRTLKKKNWRRSHGKGGHGNGSVGNRKRGQSKRWWMNYINGDLRENINHEGSETGMRGGGSFTTATPNRQILGRRSLI